MPNCLESGTTFPVVLYDFIILFPRICFIQTPSDFTVVWTIESAFLFSNNQCCKILVKPSLGWLWIINRLKEACGNFPLLQILCNTECTAFIMIGRMKRTPCIHACAEWNVHISFIISDYESLDNPFMFFLRSYIKASARLSTDSASVSNAGS